LRIGGLNVGYKSLLGVLYELDEGFSTVVVFGQTCSFGDSNRFKACPCG